MAARAALCEDHIGIRVNFYPFWQGFPIVYGRA